jgi:hypothetical protein
MRSGNSFGIGWQAIALRKLHFMRHVTHEKRDPPGVAMAMHQSQFARIANVISPSVM